MDPEECKPSLFLTKEDPTIKGGEHFVLGTA
jgi:hypothetical protein